MLICCFQNISATLPIGASGRRDAFYWCVGAPRRFLLVLGAAFDARRLRPAAQPVCVGHDGSIPDTHGLNW